MRDKFLVKVGGWRGAFHDRNAQYGTLVFIVYLLV